MLAELSLILVKHPLFFGSQVKLLHVLIDFPDRLLWFRSICERNIRDGSRLFFRSLLDFLKSRRYVLLWLAHRLLHVVVL